MKSYMIYFLSVFLVSCSNAEFRTIRAPSFSGDPVKMSSDTLCYRAAYAKYDAALIDEINSRNIDCKNILESLHKEDATQF